MSWGYKKKVEEDFDEQRYFEEEAAEKKVQPSANQQQDELEAYMKGLAEESQAKPALGQQMIEADPVDQYYQFVKKRVLKQHKQQHGLLRADRKRQQQQGQDDSDSQGGCELVDSEGDLDESALKGSQKKKIEVLEPYDYSSKLLEAFQRNFYQEHPDITTMDPKLIQEFRSREHIKIKGRNQVRPILSFAYLGFSEQLLDLISRNNFEKPTPIQAEALPAALSGRDVVGIAKTGSGKTLAYVWPMLIHILDQRQLEKNEGPIGLVLAPTRELCQQIFIQTKKYCKKFNISIGCLLGGQNKHEQWKVLKAGVDILIASPGRLIEMIRKKATNLQRITYLVIDEADKMFSLGFEQQLRSIIGQTRDDRQTLLFTATLRRTVQSLVADFLVSPITITIGEENQANEDILQEVVVVAEPQDKQPWLQKHIPDCLKRGKVLIFVNHVQTCNSLSTFFTNRLGIVAVTLHGQKNQFERTTVINSFKATDELLIATDVASRGLDVREIKTVINYDTPKDADTYIHRIGRTGRAGDRDGRAITLLSDKDHKFAILLTKILEATGSPVSPEVEQVAMKDDRYRLKRLSTKMGVSFAKGKDAKKLLNQALKRQRNSNLKAGIGYVQPDLKRKSERQLQLKDIIERNRSAMQLDTEEKPLQIGQLHLLLKQQNQKRRGVEPVNPNARTKFGGMFVASETMLNDPSQQRVTVTYGKKPPSRQEPRPPQ